MLDRLKKYLVINERNLKKHKDLIDLVIKNNPDFRVDFIHQGDQILSKEMIKNFIEYDNFDSVIKKNRLCEFWDLSYTQAINKIYEDQNKYLNCPLYYEWDTLENELNTVECGWEDFTYRNIMLKRIKIS